MFFKGNELDAMNHYAVCGSSDPALIANIVLLLWARMQGKRIQDQ